MYKINAAIIEKEKYCEDKINKVEYRNKAENHMLIYDNHEMVFDYNNMRKTIIGLINILEEIYPLGTMVELKKEYLEKIVSKDKIEKARVVIINRYMVNNYSKTYFQYAGVVYPIGMFDKEKVIQFTPALIEKVVHKGYSDKQEDAYIYLMKKELIIEKEMHSYGFYSLEN